MTWREKASAALLQLPEGREEFCGGLSIWGRVVEDTPEKTAISWTPSSGQAPWIKADASSPHGTLRGTLCSWRHEALRPGTCPGPTAGGRGGPLILHLWVSDSDSFKASKPRSQLGALAEPLPTLQSGEKGWPLLTPFRLHVTHPSQSGPRPGGGSHTNVFTSCL